MRTQGGASTIACSIHHGDWLTLAPTLDRESVDMLYADPPFNTGASKSGAVGMFDDRFTSTDAYIGWLRERLEATLPAMKPSGNVLLHVDWRTSHRVRVLLDEVLGEDRFVNHLIWSYGLGGSSPRRFARKHDDILYYAIDPTQAYFDPPMVPASSNRMKGQLKKATDVLAIPSLNNMASERVGWPTQKPLALLDVLVKACCPEGGLVLDPTCGSGTTLVSAVGLGRGAIGFDANPDAVAVAEGRIDVLTDAASSQSS